MRLTLPALALMLFALAACSADRPLAVADLPPTVAAPAPGDALQPGQRQARFADYPQTLFTAARAACAAPGQSPTEPAPGVLRCETLPTPDIAATLILGYGGTVEALPLYVISFSAAPFDTGFLVTADSYVAVPQTDGTLREVRLADPEVEAGMTELLVAAGGEPL
jgi:hypothetical protein